MSYRHERTLAATCRPGRPDEAAPLRRGGAQRCRRRHCRDGVWHPARPRSDSRQPRLRGGSQRGIRRTAPWVLSLNPTAARADLPRAAPARRRPALSAPLLDCSCAPPATSWRRPTRSTRRHGRGAAPAATTTGWGSPVRPRIVPAWVFGATGRALYRREALDVAYAGARVRRGVFATARTPTLPGACSAAAGAACTGRTVPSAPAAQARGGAAHARSTATGAQPLPAPLVERRLALAARLPARLGRDVRSPPDWNAVAAGLAEAFGGCARQIAGVAAATPPRDRVRMGRGPWFMPWGQVRPLRSRGRRSRHLRHPCPPWRLLRSPPRSCPRAWPTPATTSPSTPEPPRRARLTSHRGARVRSAARQGVRDPPTPCSP
jgi:hypothetical protein